MKIYFDHEKLDVYRESINFCGWVGEFLASISAKAAAKDQLDRASTSIPLNIAEGNGKFSAKDRARFFEMARGSALECAACLDVLVVRKLAKEEPLAGQKERLVRIVEMLVGLLHRFSDRADVLREEAPDYLSEHDYEHEHEHEHKREQEQERE
ncbi:MAG: four helix bundle protein [Verrucomicrobia bacterium]|nr:MAG: four helix bundle protein [Verrucomicrobiota bacterium]